MISRLACRTMALAVVLLLVLPAAAVAACPRTSVPDVEQEVMCPVCGTSLALATEAPQAQRERAFIQARVERCESKDEIKAALAAEFGDEVLATPGTEGFDLAAYLVPVLAVGLGGVALVVLARRWRRGRPAPSAAAATAELPPPDPGDAARLNADLERFDGRG